MSRGWCRQIGDEEARYARVAGSVGSRGPVVDVEIGMHPSELERYRLEGRMAPDPVRTQGLIDTAAGVSCVTPGVADRLLLDPVGSAMLQTASGDIASNVYSVMVRVGWREQTPPDPIPVRAHVAEIGGAEMLVGLDVLSLGEFVLDGRQARFDLILPRRGPGS